MQFLFQAGFRRDGFRNYFYNGDGVGHSFVDFKVFPRLSFHNNFKRAASLGNDSGDMTVQYVAYFTKADANLLGKIWKHSSFKEKTYLLNGDGKTISKKALETITGELKKGLQKSLNAQLGKKNKMNEVITDFTIDLTSSLVKAIWKLVDAGKTIVTISNKLASTNSDIQFTIKTNSEGFYFVYFETISGKTIYGAPAQIGVAYGKNNQTYRQFVPYAEI